MVKVILVKIGSETLKSALYKYIFNIYFIVSKYPCSRSHFDHFDFDHRDNARKSSQKTQFQALIFVNRNEKIVPLQRQNIEVATAVINRRKCEN